MHSIPDPKVKIYVGNLPFSMDKVNEARPKNKGGGGGRPFFTEIE